MRIVIAGIVLAFLAVLSTDAIAKREPLVAPRISVQNVLALSAGTPQRFRVTLLVDNINTEPMAIRRIDFKLRLANEGIIDGRTGPVRVDALDRTEVTVEVASDIVSSLSRLMAFVQGPASALPYDIYGRVTLDRRMLKELQFATSGEVPLSISSQR